LLKSQSQVLNRSYALLVLDNGFGWCFVMANGVTWKVINERFSDEEHASLKKVKGNKTWRELILQLLRPEVSALVQHP